MAGEIIFELSVDSEVKQGIHYKVPDKLIPILFEPKLIAFQYASGIVSRIFI